MGFGAIRGTEYHPSAFATCLPAVLAESATRRVCDRKGPTCMAYHHL